jgi:glycerol-3-phosphate dehydrogenase (NAD(P)+)
VKTAVIGAGAWGTTVASLLARQVETVLWARESEVVRSINDAHENAVFLAGTPLSPSLRASTELGQVVEGADLIAMAVPSRYYRAVLREAAPGIGDNTCFLSLAKGIEAASLLRMTQVAAEVLAGHDPALIGVLSGPNIAREVAAGQPSATVVAVRDTAAAAAVQRLLMNDTLRVYTNPDVIGCEIGGAVKNVIAIAAGMARGLGYGENTLAALVTRGLAELTRLGAAVGGDPLTFLGLAGIGDLMVTCHSPDSRNHRVGVALGQGRPLTEILADLRSVAEGVHSCRPVLELADRVGVEMPICEQTGAVLDGWCHPADAVAALLHRDAKPELLGISADTGVRAGREPG